MPKKGLDKPLMDGLLIHIQHGAIRNCIDRNLKQKPKKPRRRVGNLPTLLFWLFFVLFSAEHARADRRVEPIESVQGRVAALKEPQLNYHKSDQHDWRQQNEKIYFQSGIGIVLSVYRSYGHGPFRNADSIRLHGHAGGLQDRHTHAVFLPPF